jgi:hypothetical protein
MEAKELRISNLVHLIADGHENEPDLLILELEDYEFYENKMEYIKPIPLTEEWLLKFGFEKLNTTMSGCFVFQKGLWRVAIKVNIEETYEWVLWHERISPPTWCLSRFEYVHQLQNLYFALTGTELTIK